MPRPALPALTVVLSLLAVLVARPADAWAQTEPPPESAAPPAAAPASPPPAAAPVEAAPVTPIGARPAPLPALAAPASPPAVFAEPGALPPLPPTEPEPPIYKQTWFWALVGVVALTATMITIGIASQGPATPTTDLGNMRAY